MTSETSLIAQVTAKKSYSFRIQPHEVDFRGLVTLAQLVNILLTTAGYNADENGFGLRKLNEDDNSWVLLRMAIEMNIFPRQYDEIRVETWIEEVGRISTTRNFRICNNKDEIIGNACSNWAMIDLETRKARDLLTLEGIHSFASGEKSVVDKPIKTGNISGEAIDKIRVKYCDLDINHHATSMRYVEWICNIFTPETIKLKQIKRFEINFVNEMLFGDEVSIFAAEFEKDDFRFEMRKENKTTCRARVVFTPKP